MFLSLKVKYVQSLKEIAIDIPGQQVIFCVFQNRKLIGPAGNLYGQCSHQY